MNLDLFGEPLDEAPKPKAEVVRLDFNGHRVRVVNKGGDHWWVAADVCQILALGNASKAIHGNSDEDGGLDEDEKGITTLHTPGGPQEMLVVSESGLYSLIFKSRKPEAKAFRRWVTGEVLPAIRKYGTYTLGRVAKVRKRLKCDEPTAKARVESIDRNKAGARVLAESGACPRDFAEWHDAAYQGQFGRNARQLREVLRIAKGRTPLDHMGYLPLAQNSHAKFLTLKMVEESERALTPAEQADMLRDNAGRLARADLRHLGHGYTFAVKDDEARGKIVDVVRAALTAD